MNVMVLQFKNCTKKISFYYNKDYVVLIVARLFAAEDDSRQDHPQAPGCSV